MRHQCTETSEETFRSTNVDRSYSVVLVCEHASNNTPAVYEDLGLSRDDRDRHVAWDPGAMDGRVLLRRARAHDILRTIPGMGEVAAVAIWVECPEIGTLDR